MATKTETLVLLAKARQRKAAMEATANGGTDVAVPPPDLKPGSREYADWAAASARAGKKLPQVSPPPPDSQGQPQQPSLVDTIMGAVKGAGGAAYQGGIGFGKGVSNLLGLPGDLGTAIGRAVSGPDYHDFLPTGADIQHFLKQDVAPQPQNFAEHLVNRVGEELGGMAIPEAGIVSAGVRMGPTAVREGGTLAKMFLEPAAVNPVKAIATDTAAATAAGTGAGIVDSIPGVDRNTSGGQWADMAGAFGGVGLAALADKILRSVGQVGSAVFQRPNYVDQTVKDAVVDRIGKSAGLDANAGPMDTSPVIAAINRPSADSVSTVIPGFQESLADRTQNPGIASLEYARQSGPNAGEFARRRSQNSEVVDAAMRNVEPVETPGAFRSALEDNRNNAVTAAATEASNAQSDFDKYIQSLSPAMGGEDRGAAVRAGLTNAERAARESEHSAWNPITGQVDPAPLAERMQGVKDNLTMQRQQSVAEAGPTISIPQKLATDAEGNPTGKTVSIAELNDVRSEMLRQQRDALSAGDRNKAEGIGQFIDEINGYLGSDAVPADVRAATENARAVSKDVNERFNRPNDSIAATLASKEGRPNVPDSAVTRQFVQPDSGQASNIDRLLAETDLTSHGGSVRAAVKDEILAQMEKKKVLGDPAAVDQFLQSYGRVFDRFPDLRDEITQAAAAGRTFNAASANAADVTSQLGSVDGTVKGKSAVGKYLQYSDSQPERAINEVLNSKDPGAAADELMTFIGNDARAAEGARAAFWTKLKAESQSIDNSQRSMGGARAWRGDWLKSFLDKPNVKAVVERLYKDNPEALDTIRKYAEVLDNVDLRGRGKAPGTSGTAQGVNPVLTPETLQSRFTSYMRGQIGGTYLVTSIAAVVARRAIRRAQTEAIDRLTDKALLNPEFAAELLKDNNPANRAALARKAKTWLGNEASTFLQLLGGEDNKQRDETVDAATRK